MSASGSSSRLVLANMLWAPPSPPAQTEAPDTVFVPKAGQCCSNVWFPAFRKFPFLFPGTALYGKQTVLLSGSLPLFWRISHAIFSERRLFISCTGFYRLGDNFRVCHRVVIQTFQLFQCWNGEKIPVRKRQAVPRDLGLSLIHI